jgi:hypothetical protein
MSGLLAKVKISDVPENKADKLKGVGTISEVETKEASNGYVSVAIAIDFEDEKTGAERTFRARFNVKPEWFESDFDVTALEDNEKISYQINMQKLTRGVFKAAGLEDIDFDTLQGERVGFTAGPRKDDPSRLEIKSFYAPKA